MTAMASQITTFTIVYSIFYSDATQSKIQSSVSLAFMRGIHRGPVNSPHKWPVPRKMFPFDDVTMLDEFKTFLRIRRTCLQYLYELICALCQEKGIRGILCREGSGESPQNPLQDRLLVMLWYLSSQDRYSSVADKFGICESTANTAIRNRMLFTKEYLVERLITWPSNHEQQEIKGIYEETKNFPGIRGFIDGSHIAIRKPLITIIARI